MELRGKLLYLTSTSEGEHHFQFVVYPGSLWSVSLMSYASQASGFSQTWLSRILSKIDTVIDTANNDGKRVSVAEIMQHIPDVIEQGTPVLRLSYLQGGSEEFFYPSSDIKLVYGEMPLYFSIGFVSSLSELNTYLVKGVKLRYRKHYKYSDWGELPTDYLQVEMFGGTHRMVFPSATKANTNRNFSTVAVANWNKRSPYASTMSLSFANVFSNPPGNLCPGLYFCQTSLVSFNSGEDEVYGVPDPFFYDSGYDAVVPFSLDFPTDTVLSSVGMERTETFFEMSVRWGNQAGGYGAYVMPEDLIVIRPTMEEVLSGAGKAAGSSAFVPILLTLWLVGVSKWE